MAANDLNAFGNRMVRLGRKIPERSNKLLRKVFLTADQVLVLGTPVDTGRARSGWVPSVTQPSDNEPGAFSPGENLGIGEARNAAIALEKAVIVAAQHKIGQSLFITNNVVYIVPLDKGHSPQAPQGFTKQAVAAARMVVRDPNREKLTR